MENEWHSELPDGREVVIQRHGQHWIVHCGNSHVYGDNLDVALAQVIRAETGVVVAHVGGVDYPSWIRSVADRLTRDA